MKKKNNNIATLQTKNNKSNKNINISTKKKPEANPNQNQKFLRDKSKSKNKIIVNIRNKSNNTKNINKKNEEIKPQYNIDLFTGVKEEFEKDNNEGNNNNIYLKFYNKHTKNKVLQQDTSDLNQKLFNKNLEFIKEKQEKYKIKKEEEEKIKKKKEKEDTNEYRRQQMLKLYKVEELYKKEILKRKKMGVSLPPIKKKQKIISIIAKDKQKTDRDSNNLKNLNTNENKNNENDVKEENIIKITKNDYDKKINDLIKMTRSYVNELEKLPVANKTIRTFNREKELNDLINENQKEIDRYQNKVGIEFIEE